MHLIRLLLEGISVLRDGFVTVDMSPHRDQLLAIKRGELPWRQVDEWRMRLHQEFEEALYATRLPERPDWEAANAFLIRARRSVVEGYTAG